MDPIDHLTDAQHLRFESGVKERIRTKLLAHMEAHPVSQPSPYHPVAARSPFMALLHMPALALALLLIIGVGGATTFAAAGALPGDPLYAVKVNVIEPAQVFLATTPAAKAQVSVSIALSRVHEAEQLAVQDKLTPAQNVEVQNSFDTSWEQAKTTLADLSQKDPATAASLESSLDVSLDAHEAVLSRLASVTATTSAAGVETLALHVKERTKSQEADAVPEAVSAKSSDEHPIRAAVMMTALAPQPASTTASTTATEGSTATSSSSDERQHAVERERDSILYSLGL